MLVRTYILQIPYMSSNELPIHRSTFETGVSYHLRFATMKFCILLSLVMVSAAFARIPEGYELAPEDIPEYVEPTQHQLRSRVCCTRRCRLSSYLIQNVSHDVLCSVCISFSDNTGRVLLFPSL